ncbi:MAG TPA: hypothetical protein VIK91_27015, partial [Nannocystis sp.]
MIDTPRGPCNALLYGIPRRATITDPQHHAVPADEAGLEPDEPGAGRLTSLRAQIEQRYGYLPAFFEPALACPDTLADLWHAVRHAYLDSPLPERLKELTFLLAMRRSGAGLVEHALALTRQGLTPTAVLAVLDDPQAYIRQLLGRYDSLREQGLKFETWPEDPVASDSLIDCGLAFVADPHEGAAGRAALAAALAPPLYARWAALVACARGRAAWYELHPDLMRRVDPPLAEAHAWLLHEAPGLARHFGEPTP